MKRPKETFKILKRSLKNIYRSLNNGDKLCNKKSPGRQKIAVRRGDKCILRKASRKKFSLQKIAT